jgi:hypothetical protein
MIGAMSRRLPLALLALAGAAALLWALPRGTPSPRPEPDAEPAADPAPDLGEAKATPVLGTAVAGSRARPAGVDVAGTVRRADGSPAAFALVALLGAADPVTEDRAVLVRTTAGEDGTYRLRLERVPPGFSPAGASLVAASRDGKERSRPRPLSAAAPAVDAPSRLDLALVGTGAVHGRVLEWKAGSKADRPPLPEASFRWRALTAEDGLRWGPPTRVAADGSFRVESILGEVGFAVEAPGFVPQGRPGWVEAGDQEDLTTALWRAEGAVRGVVRVVDADGRPVEGVGVRAAVPTFTPERPLGRTDAAGEVPIAFGKKTSLSLRFALEGTGWVLDPELAAWEGRVTVDQADPSSPVVIRLFPAARVRGTVRTASDVPVGPGFPVTFGGGSGARTLTDEKGTFRLDEPLAAGTRDVEVGPRETRVDLVAGDNVLRLEAEDVVGFDLRPVDPVTGEPWAEEGGPTHGWTAFRGWKAHAVPDDGRGEDWIDLALDPATGRFRGWGVPAAGAGYALRVAHGGRPPFESVAPLPPLPKVGTPLRSDVALPLEGYGRVRARVRESTSGGRLPWFRIDLGVVTGGGTWIDHHIRFDERDGFHLGPLAAGRYRLHVVTDGREDVVVPAEVTSGRTTDLGEIVVGAAKPR